MNWTDIYQNTNWSFFDVLVGIIALIISVIVAYHTFFKGRKKKLLSYEILAEAKLFSIHDEAVERIEVLFDGKPAKNVSLLIIKIINNGNAPIVSSDFEVPLSFCFTEDAEVISAEINQSSENSLKPKVTFSPNKITIEPILLNVKDNFSVKALISNYENDFEINTRIIGVNKIKSYYKAPLAVKFLSSFIVSIGLLFIIGIYLRDVSPKLNSFLEVFEKDKLVGSFVGLSFILLGAMPYLRHKYLHRIS